MWTSSCWTANIGKALQLVCHTEDQLFVPNLWDVVNFFRFIWFCQFEIVKGLSILGHCPGVQLQCGWSQVPGTSNRLVFVFFVWIVKWMTCSMAAWHTIWLGMTRYLTINIYEPIGRNHHKLKERCHVASKFWQEVLDATLPMSVHELCDC